MVTNNNNSLQIIRRAGRGDRQSANQPRCVVLIHGLGAGSWTMRTIGGYLQRLGYQTAYWGYQSVGCGIPSRAARLRVDLLRLLDQHEQVAVVAHSMGAILFRAATADLDALDRFRVVMLGPPNHGSWAATLLAKRIGLICPALSQLSDSEGSYIQTLSQRVPMQTGIVAALRDRVVPLESAWLPSVRERAIVDCGHAMLTADRRVCRLVGQFLSQGTFDEVSSSRTFRQSLTS